MEENDLFAYIYKKKLKQSHHYEYIELLHCT